MASNLGRYRDYHRGLGGGWYLGLCKQRPIAEGAEGTNDESHPYSVFYGMSVAAMLCCLCSLPYLAKYSWEYRLAALDVHKGTISTDNVFVRPKEILTDIRRQFSLRECLTLPFDGQTVAKFRSVVEKSMTLKEHEGTSAVISAFTERNLPGVPLSCRSVLGCLLIGSFALPFCGTSKGMRCRYTLLAFLLSIGCVGFIGGVACNSIFVFGSYHSALASCFERYCGIFLQGWMILLLGLACQNHLRNMPEYRKNRSIVWNILLVVIFLTLLLTKVAVPKPKWEERRVRVSGIADRLLVNVPTDANVWSIWQGSSTLEQCIFHVDAFPRKLLYRPWSLGKPYSKGDTQTKNLTLVQFEAHLRTQTHLMLGRPDEQFWNTYGKLFDAVPEDKTAPAMYRIDKQENGTLKLVLVNQM